jgi:pseudouridine synthase
MPVEPSSRSSAPQQGERLQKVMAQAGLASRRKCEEYITAGRVKVNGKVVTELGTRVRPDIDLVEFDGQPVVAQKRTLLYFLLYKPVGYITTVSDPHGRPTALSLVPSEEERLYPVGRLDFNSEGLLLFTNDGDLAYRLMHPRYQHEKEYYVLAQGQLTDEELARLRQGVHIGEERIYVRAEVRRMPPDWRWRSDPVPAGSHWLQVVLHEGQKRQIRYMLEAVNHPVERLIRVRMGDLTLGPLKPGQGRWLTRSEAFALRQAAGLVHSQAEPTARRRRPHHVTANERHERREGVARNSRSTLSSEKDHNRHRRPGSVGQEHRGRRPRP